LDHDDYGDEDDNDFIAQRHFSLGVRRAPSLHVNMNMSKIYGMGWDKEGEKTV